MEGNMFGTPPMGDSMFGGPFMEDIMGGGPFIGVDMGGIPASNINHNISLFIIALQKNLKSKQCRSLKERLPFFLI